MENNGLIWRSSSFSNLNVFELYELLRLRSEIFIVEQKCLYQDLDGKDRKADHLFAVDGEHIVAACRIFGPDMVYDEASIGRVVVSEASRGKSLGHALMERALAEVEEKHGPVPVKISAQAHLQGFYNRHGFVTVSEEYLEDGLPHVAMRKG
ncbi:MAG: GNAT family N-acetyltransferase [Bacteroidetes bacterium]|jgi:ElaA protein|nr:MAG: GNAT family N-acetyltransferase [Bacteroidota bacterium]